MFNIASYLERFKKVADDKDKVRDVIQGVILEKTGITLPTQSFKIKNGELSISVTGGVKSKIFMKQGDIISMLKERLPGVFIEKIR